MKRDTRCQILIIGIMVSALILSSGLVYAAPKEKEDKENQGQGDEHRNQDPGNRDQGNQGQGQGNQGQGQGNQDQARGKSEQSQVSNSQAASHTSNSEVRRDTLERGREQAALRANRPEKTNQGIGRDHEKGTGVKRAFEKARWSYNPKDERGQGNMGKVDMRDPYGFDKDSGRKGSERGRAIHEPELDLSALMSINFYMMNEYLYWYQRLIQQYLSLAQKYPQSYSYFMGWADYYTKLLNNYYQWASQYTYDRIATNLNYNTINYSLAFAPPENLYGTTLLVTTTLTNTNSYTTYYWVYNPTTGKYEQKTIHYDAGQVITQQTQEVTLGTDNSYTFTYDPATELAGFTGFYANLSVTVTEPTSGASYTLTYDRQLYLYRCPYGKVTDTKTGQSIVGAKVSVHFEDGALVPLDKAANPISSNPQTTDATGRFGFKLETNRKYYISVNAQGYQEFKSPLFTEKWHVLREDIKLTPLTPIK